MTIDWQGMAESLGYKDRADMLLTMYKTMGCGKIADKLGMYKSDIQYHLKRLGYTPRPPGGPNNLKHGRYVGSKRKSI